MDNEQWTMNNEQQILDISYWALLIFPLFTVHCVWFIVTCTNVEAYNGQLIGWSINSF